MEDRIEELKNKYKANRAGLSSAEYRELAAQFRKERTQAGRQASERRAGGGAKKPPAEKVKTLSMEDWMKQLEESNKQP